MRPALLLLLSFLPLACSAPRFVAKKSLEMDLPDESIQALACDSHNGSIHVTAEPGRTVIHLLAEFSVRGKSQREADDNLLQMQLRTDQSGDHVHVFGSNPDRSLRNRSPTYDFTFLVPEQLAVQLQSHNGTLTVEGTRGATQLETHNGDIVATVAGARVDATTHNGDVTLHLFGDDAIDGAVTSHNGDVELELDAGANTTIEASSHNGRVRASGYLRAAETSRRQMRACVGDGAGHLVVGTHNGDVSFRVHETRLIVAN